MADKTIISRKTPKYLRPVDKDEFTITTSLRKKPYALDKTKKLSIGRGSKNDIIIPQKTTSEIHASIKWNKTHFVIKDEDSVNATYINEKRIKKATRLDDGDKIKIGRFVFTFNVKKVRVKK